MLSSSATDNQNHFVPHPKPVVTFLPPERSPLPQPVPAHPVRFRTCHVGGLREDVLLRAARTVVLLHEVGVAGGVGQSGGGQQHVHARVEHLLEVVGDQPPHFLRLHKVALVVPGDSEGSGRTVLDFNSIEMVEIDED